MSWDAELVDDRGHVECDVNYTHNTSLMIYAVLGTLDESTLPLVSSPHDGGPRWYERLNGTSGTDGAAYLAAIIAGLEADPERYRALEPANGWGSYDGLLAVLREMRDAVPEWPCEWRASG